MQFYNYLSPEGDPTSFSEGILRNIWPFCIFRYGGFCIFKAVPDSFLCSINVARDSAANRKEATGQEAAFWFSK